MGLLILLVMSTIRYSSASRLRSRQLAYNGFLPRSSARTLPARTINPTLVRRRAAGVTARISPVTHGYASRASRRLRARVRHRLNRRVRRRRRIRRARRAARRHRANPYTRHRLQGLRWVRRSIRRFRRRYQYGSRGIPLRRVNPWYSIGRWWLFGPVLNNNTINGTYNNSSLTIYYNSLIDHFASETNPSYTLPYAVDDNSTPTVAYYNNTIAFGATVSGSPATASYTVHPYSTSSSTFGPGVFASTTVFRYGTSTGSVSNVDANTTFSVMPPIPSLAVQYSGDTANPQNISYGNGTTYVQYRCYWPCIFCKISYAMKAIWPTTWTALKGSASSVDNNVLPDNPPLYVRLFGVRYPDSYPNTGTSNVYSASSFTSTVFPLGSSINARLTRTGRSNLYRATQGLIFFDKLWMFNGRITPQFQQGEVLEDSEESSFVVKVPIGYTNLSSMALNGSGSTAYWPRSSSWKCCQWYLLAQFKTPYFSYPSDDDLQPQFSVKMATSYYCYPRMAAPRYVAPFAGTGGESFNPSLSVRSVGAVGNSVAVASLDAAPVLESQGSSSAVPVSFSSDSTSTTSTAINPSE